MLSRKLSEIETILKTYKLFFSDFHFFLFCYGPDFPGESNGAIEIVKSRKFSEIETIL